MTEQEAIDMAEEAVLAAKAAVGSNRQAWYAEVLRRAEADQRIATALAMVGTLTVEASQAEKQ